MSSGVMSDILIPFFECHGYREQMEELEKTAAATPVEEQNWPPNGLSLSWFETLEAVETNACQKLLDSRRNSSGTARARIGSAGQVRGFEERYSR